MGSLTTAVASYLDARAHDGRWLVRIDDIDAPRAQPGASDLILQALEAHGLHWDGAVIWQSQHLEAYQAAADQLLRQGDAFYCSCSRAMLTAGAPYPGTCRDRREPQPDTAIRARCYDRSIDFRDGLQGPVHTDLGQTCGDFIVWRRDGLPAYQLATAVDDGAALHDGTHITDVVRGEDLREITARQLHLMQLLGLQAPRYYHVPVVVDSAGIKLSKRTGARPLTIDSASSNLTQALILMTLTPPESAQQWPCSELLDWAVEHWDLQHLRGHSALSWAAS